MPKKDFISEQALEDEIANALVYCSDGDPMVADIKRRMLHLKEELERFRRNTAKIIRLH